MKGKAAVIAVAGCVATAGAAWGMRDYRRWTALGEGGVPWGLRGWLTVTRLRAKGGDPFSLALVAGGEPHPAVAGLAQRDSRPRIAPHPVPHRQLDQPAPAELLVGLADIFAAELAARAGRLEEEQSRYERHHPAFFSPKLRELGLSSHGEVAHFHRPQGSLHMHLRPADARVVIERGWGELHPLSGRAAGLPASYTLIYAPRTDEELAAVTTILRATLDWATGSTG